MRIDWSTLVIDVENSLLVGPFAKAKVKLSHVIWPNFGPLTLPPR